MVANDVVTPCGLGLAVAVVLALSSLVEVSPTTASAQQTNLQDLTSERRQEAVERIADLLVERHLSPDVGKACAEHIRVQLADGAYDDITDPTQFAHALTADLRSVDNDWHLSVDAGPPHRPWEEEDADPEEARRRMVEKFRRENFGFRRVEVLDDNVGYLDLRSFVPTEVAGDTAVAAMTMLANCDAVIIDLRENGGGSMSMIRLIASYFFAEPKHLISFETRGEELIKQSWTQAYVPGRRMAQTPLLILTSERTGSAAEEFTYDMKHFGRATIIGETTSGGGHTAYVARVADTFNVLIPNGRPIHPVTGTGWDRVGVKPDIEVPASSALTRARLEAMKAVRQGSRASDQAPRRDP
jgi:uncharacterized protein YoaH (UPF0181 family)